MNKLEKVALRYTERRGRPLVLEISGTFPSLGLVLLLSYSGLKGRADIHLFGNDPEGIALVHQLQQRAEAWAEAGILTMIFTTDDYWPYETMKKNASRLRVRRMMN